VSDSTIGDSELPKRVGTKLLDADIDRAARTDDPVLIAGKSVAAAEVVARLIHRRSPRSGAPMRTLRCAGLPDKLLESQLFGHRRGSFPGAYCDKPGLIDVTAGGTLLLADIAEMTERAQALLERFLDAGGVRIIAAANGSLRPRIASGAFREELYRRLNKVSLRLPLLRERREDISFFVDVFLHADGRNHRTGARSISDAAMQVLLGYDWPGDVDELKIAMDRLDLLARAPLVEPVDLPDEMHGGAAPGPEAAAAI
jgi:two-component system nitrogen regulation response regulator GlnG